METIKSQALHLTIKTYVEIATSEGFIGMRWKDSAACTRAVEEQGLDPMLWFPFPDDPVPPVVQAICEGCRVRLECLSFAIYTNEQNGVWGGYRNKVIRKMRRKIHAQLRGQMPRAL